MIATKPVRHTICSCGKRGWPTKHDADQVVVNAKILRHLHNNNRRQEQRSYRCTVNHTLWHVTSQDQRAVGPRYAPTDNAAAREYIEAILLAEVDRNTEHHWQALLTPEFAAQTNAVLAEIHQAGLQVGANLKERLARDKRAWHGGQIDRSRYWTAKAEYGAWVLHWTRFQAILIARKTMAKTQAKKAIKAANIAASQSEAMLQKNYYRDVIRRLALAIDDHRRMTACPTPADRALWASLGEINIPYSSGEMSLADMIAARVWTRGNLDEPEEAS